MRYREDCIHILSALQRNALHGRPEAQRARPQVRSLAGHALESGPDCHERVAERQWHVWPHLISSAVSVVHDEGVDIAEASTYGKCVDWCGGHAPTSSETAKSRLNFTVSHSPSFCPFGRHDRVSHN